MASLATQSFRQPFKFPLFVDLAGKRCVIVGAGAVGMRRARVLSQFGARVTVIDPAPAGEAVRELDGLGARLERRSWRAEDVDHATLVVAATDVRAVNAAVADACDERGIPVSVADRAAESTFFFPAICRSEHLVAGVVSHGDDHALVARAARSVRAELTAAEGAGETGGRSRGGDADGATERAASTPGLVALIGAGPGRADLITVRGRELLDRADVVVHDRLISADVLEGVGRLSAAGRARLVDVGKHAGEHPVPQGEINRILVREASRTRLVVRLKGGDPYVFGRGGEEASYLHEAGVPFEVVPGVTSALAALSYAGIPATDRRAAASVHLVTGHRRADASDGLGIDFEALVRAGGTLVFLMAVGTLEVIANGLLAAGMDAAVPAAVVEQGTLPRQRRVDGALGSIARAARAAGVESPAILVVGEVCALAPELDWFDRLPLKGRVVAVTRPRGRAGELAGRLRALGAEVREVPLIEMRPRPAGELRDVVAALGGYAWIVLTSAEGVACLSSALDAERLDARALAGARIAAVGPATARALRGIGLRADLVPDVHDVEHLALALADAIDSRDVSSGAAASARARALLIRSSSASPELPRILRERGIAFDEVAAYDTVEAMAGGRAGTDTGSSVPDDAGGASDPGAPVADTASSDSAAPADVIAPDPHDVATLARDIRAGAVDAVTLTSGSCAWALARAMSLGPDAPWPRSCVAVCLGAPTRRVAEARGISRCVTARDATVSALVDAVVSALQGA